MILPPAPSAVPTSPPVARDAHGRWLPGTRSPNPNPPGRPVVAAEVKKLARTYSVEAIETLVELMRDKNEPGTTRKAAADSLLDRGFGKPVQQIEAGGPGAFEELEESELLAFARQKIAELFGSAGLIDDGHRDK
jgi:hypothetical protein